MEFGGLALGIAVLLIGVFALPRWIAHRKAVTESREGDRFSSGLVLVEQNSTNERLHLQPLNSTEIRLLPNASERSAASYAGGTMNTSAPLPTGAESRKSSGRPATKKTRMTRGTLEGVEGMELIYSDVSRGHVSREISRLRSKRAGRIAREKAAGRRRFLTAAVAAVLVLAVGGGATFATLSWWWITLPGAFLAITLTVSIAAGQRSAHQNELENAYLLALEAKLRGEEIPEQIEKVLSGEIRVGRNGARKTSVQQAEAESASRSEAELGSYSSSSAAKKTNAKASAETSGEKSADSWFGIDSKAEQLRVDTFQAMANNSQTAQEIFTNTSDSGKDEFARAQQVFESIANENIASDRKEQSRGAEPAAPSILVSEEVFTERRTKSWSVATIPKPVYATKERVKRRAVHIDTDINPLLKLENPKESVPVPGRPVALTHTQNDELTNLHGSSTDFSSEKRANAEPSLKFNLEAVLEQRRAK